MRVPRLPHPYLGRFACTSFGLAMGRRERPLRPWINTEAGALSLLGCLLLGVLALACGRSENPPPEARAKLDESHAREVIATYSQIALAIYVDSLNAARALDAALADFVSAPSAERMQAAREAWLLARLPYVQSEVFRFYDGPIDRVEPWVNSWPIDENFVDTVDPSSPPGLIADREHYPEITEALLLKLNESASETSISTGYHVIEFLLWGQDLNPHGPGARAYTDFVGNGPKSVEVRRGQYVKVASRLLVKHLEEVVEEWGRFGKSLLEMPVQKSLGLALKGMGALSGPELAGERLTVAYETKDQENEHSCFSDSTHADMAGDALGVQNLCLGRYLRTDGSEVKGAGICALVRSVDAALGESLEQQIRASVQAARSIPAPFDQAILGTDSAPGRRAVLKTIRALEMQLGSITRSAAVLGADLGLATARAGSP